eukprot:SAG31_NODE_1332_length_8743_cov_20.800810_9_plen_135_part_00
MPICRLCLRIYDELALSFELVNSAHEFAVAAKRSTIGKTEMMQAIDEIDMGDSMSVQLTKWLEQHVAVEQNSKGVKRSKDVPSAPSVNNSALQTCRSHRREAEKKGVGIFQVFCGAPGICEGCSTTRRVYRRYC